MQVQLYTRIGSITKTFIGTLILQLVGEGKLGLDEPIQRWAPQVPNAQHITVREILNMSSGLYDYSDDQQWGRQALAPTEQLLARQWAPEQLVRVAVAHKPYFAPGKGYHYSNTNLILLGLIIEQVTGRPVQDVLRTRILQPLGLTHTIFPTTAAMPSPHLHGYTVTGGRLTEVNTMANMSAAWTAGAMISTLADLHTWAQALATGRLLSPALQKQRLTLSPPSVAYFRHHGVAGGYGLGIANVYCMASSDIMAGCRASLRTRGTCRPYRPPSWLSPTAMHSCRCERREDDERKRTQRISFSPGLPRLSPACSVRPEHTRARRCGLSHDQRACAAPPGSQGVVRVRSRHLRSTGSRWAGTVRH
jgi:CubicO group peptidase (beta-lactamase class C family)